MPEPRDAAIARQRLVIDALVESRLAGSAGDMTECQAHEVASLVDRAVLWPLLRAEHDRLHSWAGLMSLLDEHWPDAVFRGTSGDPGPTIVFLLRQVDQLKAERARVQVEAVELRESLERMTERSDGWQGDANRYGGELDDLRRIVGEYFGIEITNTASLPEEVRALIAKAARAERQAHEERSSRQAWAVEAEQLQADLDEIMKPAIWDLPHKYRNNGSGEHGVPGDCRTCGRPIFDDLHDPPEPPKITVCACITDEQAAQLGPRFSRPVCAVHPTQPEPSGRWLTHPRSGVMHLVMRGGNTAECGWASAATASWRKGVAGNAHCNACMERSPLELLGALPTRGDRPSGTPWTEGGDA